VLRHQHHLALMGCVHVGGSEVELVHELARVLDVDADRLPGIQRDRSRLVLAG
jgi:hypothetical protein